MKRSIAYLLLTLIMFIFVACKNTNYDEPSQLNPSPSVNMLPDSQKPLEDSEINSMNVVGNPSVAYITYPKEDFSGVITEKVKLGEKNTSFLEELIARGVLLEGTKILSCNFLEDNMIVNLSAEFQELLDVQGSSGEVMVLGCLVNSILDTYAADNVSLLVEGKALQLGHGEYQGSYGLFDVNELK